MWLAKVIAPDERLSFFTRLLPDSATYRYVPAEFTASPCGTLNLLFALPGGVDPNVATVTFVLLL